ncbi:hypothetical protein BC834DRAFT_814798 [Gloeopeniophorella convolvens]|nr:hypothetical protein BC834DRAFT_814798 [Gloeopeniophorella convolvens]
MSLYIRSTLGAILLGCMLSVALSGMAGVQTFLYFRMYPQDNVRIKLMIPGRSLDAVHTALMCAATWDFLILNFGNDAIADFIPLYAPFLTVAFTAMITFVTHLFFSHRVYRLSKDNWVITLPLVLLAFGRLGAALVSTIEMGRLRSFRAFTDDYGYVFTLGLSLACMLDVLITAAMCFFLHQSRTGFSGMDHIIDMIMIYTLNTGALTCATTVVSMICWLTMSRNLIFLGLHFAISKLYANSLLATLNTRRSLRNYHSKSGGDGEHALPVLFPSTFSGMRQTQLHGSGLSRGEEEGGVSKLEINVEKTIQYEVDDLGSGSAAVGRRSLTSS